MVALDILAPISLMYGLHTTTSANASLLNNFEIVTSTVIAFVILKEIISKRLWQSVFFVTVSSLELSAENFTGVQFSWGCYLYYRGLYAGDLKTTAPGKFRLKAHIAIH